MSDFVVSARKYRPSTFASVVGQDALTTTLKNAILRDKLSHAYLFCGPRGVGKTSCARIFAKTINCQNRTPDGEACNECESCKAANEGRSMNIFELDAASNNSVDNIRQITEQVYVAPTEGKYRVYIIDEVHMLSSSAFNAFLKTLEEPPEHAIFILATTEKNKVLPTIISRCQVHDFNRITASDIARHLQYVAHEEGILADPEALQLIAWSADGGMRDALSMFDQIAGFGGGVVTKEGVRSNLNLLDEDEYFALLAHILRGNHTKVLTLVDSLLSRGYEGDVVMRGFSSFLRNVLLSQSPETIDLVEAPETIKARLQKAGAYARTALLWEYLKISTAFGAQYKNNSEKRLALEVALLKMVEKNPTGPLVLRDEPDTGHNTGPIVASSTPTGKVDQKVGQQPSTQPKAEPQSTVQVASPRREETETTPPTLTAPPTKETKPQTDTAQDRPRRAPRPNRTYSTIMGYNVLSGKTREEEENDQDGTEEVRENRDAPFRIEDLKRSWQNYASSLDPKKKMFVVQQLKNYFPKETEEPHLFVVTVESDVAKHQLDEEMPMLRKFLSNELRNDLFRIEVKVSDNKNRVVLPQSPSEKMQYLKEKNSNLSRLSDELGLIPLS